MDDFEIVDAHVHLYRDLATEKRALPIPGRRDRDRWGNAESVIPYMDREGVSHIVVLNLYPTGVMRRALRAKLPTGLAGADLDDAHCSECPARFAADIEERLPPFGVEGR
jgi:hypothetical protein